ncbi:MAG TPA: 50S ribosomal protein L3 N(5)-glutamine methyltransferase [Steroidobacteraceae bacterium]|nr:50S ribosomal protein L3 N(5)-glutamine methyltransferase [Steroidobacteraceae bacterium]
MTKKPRAGVRPPANVGTLLDRAAARLAKARLHYGHGTDCPRDDAAALVFHALGLAHESAPGSYRLPVSAQDGCRVDALVERRIRERLPSAYLTGVSWFAGHEIRVTPDVLVPRSPIAELCLAGFAPWIDPARVGRVLDIGTGSGCIAIAAAHALPRARVDATDVSAAARAVARGNLRRHRLGRRVRVVAADVYDGLGGRRYDVIVSNPPYVPATEMRRLPREHRAEPSTSLRAARQGLAIIERIVAGARRHLTRQGILVVEAGNSAGRVRRRFPGLPLVWLEFEHGFSEVFLLRAADLPG